jgi:hypothetical protein
MNLLQDMSTQSKPKKTRKPKTKRLYFGPEVDISIVKYNSTEDSAERSRIYQKEIKPAFEKLVQNIIHTFKFYYTDSQTLEQVQHEVVSFLVEKLPKFKAPNGKAFSYFSIVAKNYCILKNKNNYKKLTSHDRIDMAIDSELEHIPDDTDTEHNVSDFIDKFVEYWDNNLETTFTKKADRLLAASVIELFRKRERIELFNKKALYIYIREMSDASTQQITKMVKTMKEKYASMYTDYLQYGSILKNKTY